VWDFTGGVHNTDEMLESATDPQLIKNYLSGNAGAFSELVRRHVGLVYSAALRQTRNVQTAEDVTQAVFLLLSQRARHFGSGVVVAAWLYRAAHFAAKDAIKKQRRRQFHESKAAMRADATGENTADDQFWPEVESLLDDAMLSLRQRDRTAILLRYFEGQSIREVSNALGSTEAATGQRLARALDRLRRYFAVHGAPVPLAGLAATITRHAITPPPSTLAILPLSEATRHLTTISIAKGAAKMMFWSNARLVLAGSVGILAIVLPAIVLGTAPQAAPQSPPAQPTTATTQPWQTPLPDGGTLQVFLTDPDENPRRFWKPDSTPFDPASLFPYQLNIEKQVLKPGQRRIVILVRPTDAQAHHIYFSFSASNVESFGGGASVEKGGKWVRDDWEAMMVTLDSQRSGFGIELGLPLGQWRMIADWGTYGQMAHEHYSDRRFIVQPGLPAARNGDLGVPVALYFPQIFDWSTRLTAVLTNGKRQPASTGLGMRVMNGVGITSFRFDRDLAIKPDDVKTYELEVIGNTKVRIQHLATSTRLRTLPVVQVTPPPQLPVLK
jgi:RNA polymerase sigma factor (sigma-70 family)